jgi:protein TonB
MKKTKKKFNYEKYKFSYFLFGLILALGFSIMVINWKFTSSIPEDTSCISTPEIDEYTAIHMVKMKKPKAPTPPKIIIDIPKPKIDIPEPKPVIDPEPNVKTDNLASTLDSGLIDIAEPEDFVEDIIPTMVDKVEIFPHFSNCDGENEELRVCLNEGIFAHVKKNFKYPRREKQMEIQERIILKFVINKHGKVDKVQTLRGKNKNLIKEAERLIQSIPKMVPAEQNGRYVPVYYTVPIDFRLR